MPVCLFFQTLPLIAMKMNKFLASLLLAKALCLASCLPAMAQSYAEPAKGYWQVHTDPNTRSTVVQFFDGSNQLLYQESMSRKYIKLSRRNVRVFDELLARLMDRELLSSKVKSYDLVADSRTEFRSAAPVEAPVGGANVKTAVSNIYVVREGKMKIILKNPAEERYDIRIMDTNMRTVYYESMNHAAYGRWFDMSRLEQGTYSIHITSPRKKLNYKLTVDDYQGYKLEDVK